MLRQLQLIALNYFRRTSVLMVLAVVLLSAVCLFVMTGRRVNYAVHFPDPARDLFSVEHISHREGSLSEQITANNAAGTARTINLFGFKIGTSEWNTLAQLPDLRRLSLHHGSLIGRQRSPLPLPPRLEILCLENVALTDESIGQISRLNGLRCLSLGDCRYESGFSSPNRLKQLDTLILREVEGLDQLLEDLTQLPSLRVLVLPGIRTVDRWESILPLFGDLPHLQSLYFNNLRLENAGDLARLDRYDREMLANLEVRSNVSIGTTFDDTLLLAKFRQQLPRTDVQPALINRIRIDWASAAYVVVFFILMGIGLQLMSQFSQPGARLIPGFATPHLLFPALLVGCYVMIAVSLLHWRVQIAPSASVGFMMVTILIQFLIIGMANGLFSGRPNVRFGASLGVAGVLPLFFGMIPDSIGFPLDAYLRGEQPVIALGLIVTSALMLLLLATRVKRLPVMLAELGVNAPLMSNKDVQASNERSKDRRLSVSRQTPGNWIIRRQQPRLDSLLKRVRPVRMWHRIQLYRIQDPQMRTAVWVQVVAALAFFLYFGWFRIPNASGQSGRVSTIGDRTDTFLVMAVAMLALPIAAAWWRRGSTLAIDLLRPTSRRQLCNDLFAAAAVDFSPTLIVSLLVLAIIGDDAWTAPFWAAIVLFWTGLWLVLYTGTLVVMTVRSRWVALFAVLPFFAVQLAVFLPLYRETPNDGGAGVFQFIGPTLVLLGAGLFLLARRRWWDMELP